MLIFITIVIVIIGFIIHDNLSKQPKNDKMEEYQYARDSYSRQIGEKIQPLEGTMKEKYPNLFNYGYDKRYELKMELYKDDGRNIEFKHPIFNKGIIGYVHHGIEDVYGKPHIYVDVKFKNGKLFRGARLPIEEDLTKDEYNEVLGQMILHHWSNNDYVQALMSS